MYLYWDENDVDPLALAAGNGMPASRDDMGKKRMEGVVKKFPEKGSNTHVLPNASICESRLPDFSRLQRDSHQQLVASIPLVAIYFAELTQLMVLDPKQRIQKSYQLSQTPPSQPPRPHQDGIPRRI